MFDGECAAGRGTSFYSTQSYKFTYLLATEIRVPILSTLSPIINKVSTCIVEGNSCGIRGALLIEQLARDANIIPRRLLPIRIAQQSGWVIRDNERDTGVAMHLIPQIAQAALGVE